MQAMRVGPVSDAGIMREGMEVIMWKFMGRKRYVVHVAALLSSLFLSQAVLAANNAKFTATLLQSGCTVSFANGAGAAITTLSLGDIDSASMTGKGNDVTHSIALPAQLLKLKLSGCGMAQSGKVPAVKLMGINATAPDVTAGNGFPYKFRDAGAAGGTSHDYFVVIGKTASLVYQPASNPNGLYNSTTDIISLGAAGVSGQGIDYPLYVSVSCDQFCESPTTRAGSLKATLVFEFLYK